MYRSRVGRLVVGSLQFGIRNPLYYSSTTVQARENEHSNLVPSHTHPPHAYTGVDLITNIGVYLLPSSPVDQRVGHVRDRDTGVDPYPLSLPRRACLRGRTTGAPTGEEERRYKHILVMRLHYYRLLLQVRPVCSVQCTRRALPPVPFSPSLPNAPLSLFTTHTHTHTHTFSLRVLPSSSAAWIFTQVHDYDYRELHVLQHAHHHPMRPSTRRRRY